MRKRLPELRSLSLAASGSTLTITVPNMNFLDIEGFRYRFIICQKIPCAAIEGQYVCVLTDGTNTVPLECLNGNDTRADQLRHGFAYFMRNGTSKLHETFCCSLPQSKFFAPIGGLSEQDASTS